MVSQNAVAWPIHADGTQLYCIFDANSSTVALICYEASIHDI